jgi:SulP family sulfate permease
VLLLSGLRKAPLQELQRLGTLDIIGRRNIMPDINAALERARAITGTHDRTRRQPDRHSSSGRTASSLS